MNRLPNFVIAGCQKSGTTWTHHALAKHSLILGSNPKELNFFNKTSVHIEEELEAYKSNFPQGKELVYMESTPHYFQLPNEHVDTASNMKNLLGSDVKVLAIFRNPIERAVSAIIHHMMQGRLPLVQEIDSVPEGFKIKELGMYSEILKHWQLVFGDNLIIRFYDEIVSNPKEYIDSLCQELGVPSDIPAASLDFRVNDKNIKAKKQNITQIPKCSLGLIETLSDEFESSIKELFSVCDVFFDDWLDIDKLNTFINK